MTAARRIGNRARCQHESCEKFAQTRGLCKAHGGGSRCRDASCNKLAQSRGLCIAHGGGRRCQSDGCQKLAQSKGYCISHGGGRRCTVPECEKFSQVKGRCKSHSKQLSSPPPSNADTSSDCSPVNSPVGSESSRRERAAKLRIDFLVNPTLARAQSIENNNNQLQGMGLPARIKLEPERHHAPPMDQVRSALRHLPIQPMQPAKSAPPSSYEDATMVFRRGSVDHVIDPFSRIPSIAPRAPETSRINAAYQHYSCPTHMGYASPHKLQPLAGAEVQPLSRFADTKPSQFGNRLSLLSFLNRPQSATATSSSLPTTASTYRAASVSSHSPTQRFTLRPLSSLP